MKYKYTTAEYEELDRLMKTAITDYAKLDWFYSLYKKYIDANAPRPSSNCGNCALSIETYFNTFREWFVNNGNLFG